MSESVRARSSDPRAIEAGRRARARFESGANCAESLLASVPEALGDDSLRLPPAAGRGFTGGIGESGCICGALAAATMIAGAESERRAVSGGAARVAAVDLGAEVHDRFASRFGGTCCRVLRQGMAHDSPECRESCARITEEAAAMVVELLAESRSGPSRADRPSGRDVTEGAATAFRLLAAGGIGASAVWLATGGGGAAIGTLAAALLVLALLLVSPRLRRLGR